MTIQYQGSNELAAKLQAKRKKMAEAAAAGEDSDDSDDPARGNPFFHNSGLLRAIGALVTLAVHDNDKTLRIFMFPEHDDFRDLLWAHIEETPALRPLLATKDAGMAFLEVERPANQTLYCCLYLLSCQR